MCILLYIYFQREVHLCCILMLLTLSGVFSFRFPIPLPLLFTSMFAKKSLAFFTCRSADKPGALLFLLREVIPSDDMTIVFVATRHHAEFICEVCLRGLIAVGYWVSYRDWR